MGLFRKVESGIERAVGGLFGRTFKGNVEPVELASKLVTELEQHKTSSVSRVYIPNDFTIFLCVDDRRHLRSFESSLSEELEAHVVQHARQQGYTLVGPPRVGFKTDTDLKLGQFGILAEMNEEPAGGGERIAASLDEAGAPSPGRSAEPVRPSWLPEAAVPADVGGDLADAEADDWAALQPPSAPSRFDAPPEPAADGPVAPPSGSPAESLEPEPRILPINPKVLDTQNIPAQVAGDLDLARDTIVLSQPGHSEEFHKGRVLLGRAKSVDFQLDDPNVSRQHAAVYWEQGRLFVKDLGSTNGTLLNGKPVTAGPLADGDVLTLGDSEVVVDTG